MKKLALVLGPQGVGKTVVCQEAAKRSDFKLINFGTVLQEIVGEDRDKFRRESKVADFAKIQKKAAEKIAGMVKKNSVILTSHAVLLNRAGFYPGFPKFVLDKIRPSGIILITAKPEEIAVRKEQDRDLQRTRDEVPVEHIMEEQTATKLIAYAYSMYTGAPVKEIPNNQGLIDEAVNELVQTLNSL